MKHLSFGRILLPLLLLASCSRLPVQITGELGVLPDIYPDYKEVTVPINIAPLNFRCDSLEGPAALILSSGERRCTLRGPAFDIPVKAWRELTEAGDISATVCVKGKDGWKAFLPFTIHVSPDPIDPYVAYRLIAPGYETWNRMGLYQRCLEDFTEKAYMTNEETDRNCMNCHSFCNRDPQRMMFHMRARNGGTFTWDGTTIEKLNTKTPRTLSALVYPRWHPSGRYIAFSVNDIAQFFHSTDPNRIEVYDSVSDVVVYDVENHEVSGTPLLMDTTRLETMPAWAPDGRTLYFCSSDQPQMPQGYRDIRYSIRSIAFDPDAFTFGDRVETVYDALARGKDATFPRVSPDGRFLLFAETAYGCFAIWHKDADLRMIDLRDGSFHDLEALNGPDADSYHCWSSNSRWVVWASRRLDGLYSRLFIAHIDADGNPSKPFLLPQQDTRRDARLLCSYNVPEFITGPVTFDPKEMAHIAKTDPGIDVTFKQP